MNTDSDPWCSGSPESNEGQSKFTGGQQQQILGGVTEINITN